MKLYGLEQVGCYADGTFGHAHIRSTLSGLLYELRCNITHLFIGRDTIHAVSPSNKLKHLGFNRMGVNHYLSIVDTAKSLMGNLDGEPPSDDFSEEDDAIDLLNEHATDGTVSFGMFEGDLVLASNRQWEAGSIYSEEWYGLESGNNVVLESSEV